MSKLYNILENALNDIETGLKNGINADNLAEKHGFSSGHLRRLFKFSFNQTISEYIRSRKLSSSIDDLLNTDANIIDIAIDYDFEYEQSYIRSFKREFGITPGELRKSGQVLKVKPPLQLFDENKLEDGLLFGPNIVIVPQFHVIGKLYAIPFHDAFIAHDAAINFWKNEKQLIANTVNPDVYIGITRGGYDNDVSHYLTSIQVSSIDSIPDGYCADTFDTTLCARFRYIGQHHFYEINRKTAKSMYEAIGKFANDHKSKYGLARDKVYFEKVDASLYDGTYCQMEWFTPVIAKSTIKPVSKANNTTNNK